MPEFIEETRHKLNTHTETSHLYSQVKTGYFTNPEI